MQAKKSVDAIRDADFDIQVKANLESFKVNFLPPKIIKFFRSFVVQLKI